VNNLPDDLKEFVHSMIDEYIKDQTKRFPAGVHKYGNHIINDYTIEEHIANLKEEHRDADAYTKAIEILVGKLRDENAELRAANEQLKEYVGDL